MKKILLASDGSTNANEAARFLAHLPHRDKLEIVVLTVIEAPYANRSYPLESMIEMLKEREEGVATQTYEKVSQMFEGANVRIRREIREGHVGETIVQAAREEEAELVVIGACGRSRIARILLGSNSDYVATHADCSVLVFRAEEDDDPKRTLRIAIGYEESGPAEAALEEFADFEWGHEPHVTVVAIAPFLHAYGNSLNANTNSLKYLADAAEGAAESVRHAAPEVSSKVIDGEHVGEELVRFVEDDDSDLLVIGETPRALLGRLVLGSNSRFVLRHAPCSVWITRNRMIEGISRDAADNESIAGESPDQAREPV
ncbi:MAG: universal stress protein [Pirellulaceae bacterium]|nr:universal stress protein [Pirellulaceae bacterium]